MTQLERNVQDLYDRGYLWRILPSELKQLNATTPELIEAINEYQHDNEDAFAIAHHHYHYDAPQYRGTPGPALDSVLARPRCCTLPDIPPPADALFSFDDPDLQLAVDSQQKFAATSEGTGAWPFGCWEDFPDMHRVVIAVDESNMPSHWAPHWEWCKSEARTHYSWAGVRLDYVAAGERADIRMQWRGGGSWIGLAQFPSNSCLAELFQYLAPRYNPRSRKMRRNVHMHELGHNLGLQHVRGANRDNNWERWLMDPTINDFDPDVRNDKHWGTLVDYFGGKGSPETILGDPDPDHPTPPPTKLDLPTHGPNCLWVDGLRIRKIWIEE